MNICSRTLAMNRLCPYTYDTFQYRKWCIGFLNPDSDWYGGKGKEWFVEGKAAGKTWEEKNL
jgi:hypothetical protein